MLGFFFTCKPVSRCKVINIINIIHEILIFYIILIFDKISIILLYNKYYINITLPFKNVESVSLFRL